MYISYLKNIYIYVYHIYMYIIYIWYIFDIYMIYIWYIYDIYMIYIHIWYIYMVYIYIYDIYIYDIYIWYIYIYLWFIYIYGIYIRYIYIYIYIWYMYIYIYIYIWYIYINDIFGFSHNGLHVGPWGYQRRCLGMHQDSGLKQQRDGGVIVDYSWFIEYLLSCASCFVIRRVDAFLDINLTSLSSPKNLTLWHGTSHAEERWRVFFKADRAFGVPKAPCLDGGCSPWGKHENTWLLPWVKISDLTINSRFHPWIMDKNLEIIWWSSNGNFETIKACFFLARDFQTNPWSNLQMVDTWMVCGIVDQSYLKKNGTKTFIHSRTIALSCLAPIKWTCLPEKKMATADDLTWRPDLRRQLLFCSAGSLIRRKLGMPRLQPPASARRKAEFWRDFGSLRWQSFVDNVARCRPGPWLVHSLVHSYPMVPPLWLIIIPLESR